MPDNDDNVTSEGEPIRLLGTEDFEVVEVPFPNFYVNSIAVNSNVLDFALTMMERLDSKNATIKARVVMTPVHAKLLLNTLADNLRKWEAKHGEIKVPPAKFTAPATPPSDSSNEPEQQS